MSRPFASMAGDGLRLRVGRRLGHGQIGGEVPIPAPDGPLEADLAG